MNWDYKVGMGEKGGERTTLSPLPLATASTISFVSLAEGSSPDLVVVADDGTEAGARTEANPIPFPPSCPTHTHLPIEVKGRSNLSNRRSYLGAFWEANLPLPTLGCLHLYTHIWAGIRNHFP